MAAPATNIEKTKYVLMSCYQNARQNHDINTGNKLFDGTANSSIVQGGSNMTGTNCDFTDKSSRSYLNHLVILLINAALRNKFKSSYIYKMPAINQFRITWHILWHSYFMNEWKLILSNILTDGCSLRMT
jgi:hypothetical protein